MLKPAILFLGLILAFAITYILWPKSSRQQLSQTINSKSAQLAYSADSILPLDKSAPPKVSDSLSSPVKNTEHSARLLLEDHEPTASASAEAIKPLIRDNSGADSAKADQKSSRKTDLPETESPLTNQELITQELVVPEGFVAPLVFLEDETAPTKNEIVSRLSQEIEQEFLKEVLPLFEQKLTPQELIGPWEAARKKADDRFNALFGNEEAIRRSVRAGREALGLE